MDMVKKHQGIFLSVRDLEKKAFGSNFKRFFYGKKVNNFVHQRLAIQKCSEYYIPQHSDLKKANFGHLTKNYKKEKKKYNSV